MKVTRTESELADCRATYDESVARLKANNAALLEALKACLDYMDPKHNNGHTADWTKATIAAAHAAMRSRGVV